MSSCQPAPQRRRCLLRFDTHVLLAVPNFLPHQRLQRVRTCMETGAGLCAETWNTSTAPTTRSPLRRAASRPQHELAAPCSEAAARLNAHPLPQAALNDADVQLVFSGEVRAGRAFVFGCRRPMVKFKRIFEHIFDVKIYHVTRDCGTVTFTLMGRLRRRSDSARLRRLSFSPSSPAMPYMRHGTSSVRRKDWSESSGEILHSTASGRVLADRKSKATATLLRCMHRNGGRAKASIAYY